MKVKLSFPKAVEVEVGKSTDVKVQVSEVGSEPSYPDDTFWRHKDAKIDPRVFYVPVTPPTEEQKRRHVENKAWKPMSEEKGVTWADVNALPEEEWRIFLHSVPEGDPIEKWPEEEHNHLTKKIYAISHSSPSKTWVLTELHELGFNVFHTNDAMKFKVEDYTKWLDKCRKLGMLLLPRVVFNDKLKDVLLAIKDDDALAGIAWHDELDCFNISKEDQRRFAEYCEKYAPNVLRFATINQGDWSKWVDFDSWDIIMASCSPILKEGIDYESMERQLQRIRDWCPPTKPLMITTQGWMTEKTGKPDALWQYNWWNEHIPGGMNSYSIYLHGAGCSPEVTGFAQEKEMRESVRKLNKQLLGS